MEMIRVENLVKTFNTADAKIHAVHDISFSVQEGEIFGVIGLSGAGKSTLVRCLNLLEKPDSGRIFIGDREITAMKNRDLMLERRKIGMIFQSYNLLMQRSVLDNVCFPLEIAGVHKKESREKAMEYLETVGLAEKARAYPSQLSGGQKQRVAIVRALCMHPEILLFDEVTAALDPEMVREVLEVILDLANEGKTMLIVTHEMQFARAVADRIVFLEGGHILEQAPPEEFFDNPKTQRAREFLNTFTFARKQRKA